MQNSQEWTYGILTLADGNNGASVLLCVKQGNYYIFDSHSRDTFGNMVANGTSVLLHLKTHNGFIKYIKSIGYQLHATQFEIMVLSPISSALHRMLQPTQHSQNTQNRQNKTSTVEISEQRKLKFMMTILKEDEVLASLVKKNKINKVTLTVVKKEVLALLLTNISKHKIH